MNTVAKSLKPPFIAAIMLDAIQAGGKDGPSPSDELISIAPAQEGFLGLETTCDNQGRWISISYWRDQTCFNGWRNAGSAHVAQLFDGLRLAQNIPGHSNNLLPYRGNFGKVFAITGEDLYA